MTESQKKEVLQESRLLEALAHPNIVKFIEVYKTKKGKLCIIMDFADGGDLAQKLKEQKGQYVSEA
jgi:NIMA (never in mitosis gene a)-related kinase 1/4/5